MHYTVSYEGLSSQEKHDKALGDLKEYLGEDRFEQLTRELSRHPDLTLEQFEFYASFAGVQGYPVRAWYLHCFPEKWSDGYGLIHTKEVTK